MFGCTESAIKVKSSLRLKDELNEKYGWVILWLAWNFSVSFKPGCAPCTSSDIIKALRNRRWGRQRERETAGGENHTGLFDKNSSSPHLFPHAHKRSLSYSFSLELMWSDNVMISECYHSPGVFYRFTQRVTGCSSFSQTKHKHIHHDYRQSKLQKTLEREMGKKEKMNLPPEKYLMSGAISFKWNPFERRPVQQHQKSKVCTSVLTGYNSRQLQWSCFDMEITVQMSMVFAGRHVALMKSDINR